MRTWLSKLLSQSILSSDFSGSLIHHANNDFIKDMVESDINSTVQNTLNEV